MKKTEQAVTEQHAPLVLSPLPDALNLLDEDAAGYCSGGVCHFSAPPPQ